MNTVKALCKFMDKNDIYFYLNDSKYGQAFIIYDSDKFDKVKQEWYRLCGLKTSDTGKYDTNFYYEDSVYICDGCGKIIESLNYGKPDYCIDHDLGVVSCGDCVKKSPESYLQFLKNNSKRGL